MVDVLFDTVCNARGYGLGRVQLVVCKNEPTVFAAADRAVGKILVARDHKADLITGEGSCFVEHRIKANAVYAACADGGLVGCDRRFRGVESRIFRNTGINSRHPFLICEIAAADDDIVFVDFDRKTFTAGNGLVCIRPQIAAGGGVHIACAARAAVNKRCFRMQTPMAVTGKENRVRIAFKDGLHFVVVVDAAPVLTGKRPGDRVVDGLVHKDKGVGIFGGGLA